MDAILKLLAEDARLSLEQLASLTGLSEADVAEHMDKLRRDKVIVGYKAVIDWERAGSDTVNAMIEIRISPKKDYGFDEFATSVAMFPEVESVYLMSGGYDIALMLHGASFKDIAMFVGRRLSPMDSVLSTATHFVLKKYKDQGVLFAEQQKDERGFGIF